MAKETLDKRFKVMSILTHRLREVFVAHFPSDPSSLIMEQISALVSVCLYTSQDICRAAFGTTQPSLRFAASSTCSVQLGFHNDFSPCTMFTVTVTSYFR